MQSDDAQSADADWGGSAQEAHLKQEQHKPVGQQLATTSTAFHA